MSKRSTLIYFCIAPLLFGLSWFISHRVLPRAQSFGTGQISPENKHVSLIYACLITGIYLAAYLAIRDIYRPTNQGKSSSSPE